MKISSCTFIMVLLNWPLIVTSQLYIQKNVLFHLQRNASITVQGDVSSNSATTGEGVLNITGQNRILDFRGHTIYAITLDESNISLLSNVFVEKELGLVNSRLNLNGHTMEMGEAAQILADGNSGIIGGVNGWVRKNISSNLEQFSIPFINRNGVSHRLVLNTRANYQRAFVEIASVDERLRSIPGQPVNAIDHYWIVRQQGIFGKVNALAAFDNLKSDPFSGAELRPVIISEIRRGDMARIKSNSFLANVTASESFITAVEADRAATGLSPNPASTHTVLTVYSDQEKRAEIRITDMNSHVMYGEVVNLNPGVNRIYIALPNMANGTYDLTIIDKEGRSTLKLVKI